MSELILGEEILINTEYGKFTFRYASLENKEALIVTKSIDFNTKKIALRIHSSCVFSESFRAINCDCADQLIDAIKIISEVSGVVIYLFDEGRGVGLMKKIEAIKLQNDLSINTAEAFKMLGFNQDERGFELAISIIKELFTSFEIELITNNPLKIEKIKKSGISIKKVIPSIHSKNNEIREYLIEKKEYLGHNIPKI